MTTISEGRWQIDDQCQMLIDRLAQSNNRKSAIDQQSAIGDLKS
jgi:hypothetical protein